MGRRDRATTTRVLAAAAAALPRVGSRCHPSRIVHSSSSSSSSRAAGPVAARVPPLHIVAGGLLLVAVAQSPPAEATRPVQVATTLMRCWQNLTWQLHHLRQCQHHHYQQQQQQQHAATVAVCRRQTALRCRCLHPTPAASGVTQSCDDCLARGWLLQLTGRTVSPPRGAHDSWWPASPLTVSYTPLNVSHDHYV